MKLELLLEQLNEVQKQSFLLSYAGFSNEEISNKMKLSVEMVNINLGSAKAKLKSSLTNVTQQHSYIGVSVA